MKTFFRTQNGSTYQIDYNAKTWKSIKKAQTSGLRTLGGTFQFATEEPMVGQAFIIVAPPLDPTMGVRIITTSLVERVFSDEGAELAREIVAGESLGG